MIPLLRAEYRKMFSVRSTYIISSIALLLIAFLAFYIEGVRGFVPHPSWLTNMINSVSTTVAIFIALVAILSIGHEYRYNTITYTFAAANSRTKVMLAKMITILCYAFGLTVISCLLAVFAYWLGILVSPNETQVWLVPEIKWEPIWRSLFFTLSFGIIGLILGFLFRHLVGAIAALFIWPSVEGMLGPLLRGGGRYLPFSTLEQVHSGAVWNPATAAWLFLAYLLAFSLLAWYLFTRRDAN